ncbi:hypothetical protein CEXT_333891 [Caerostris extrusa]|uniref:Uncharacterized protein n=1 Tax=Caerostris extrusa TaxID=172846 RepID=A0AAV4MMA1_CAEEX|nr:hypothetical protein CEXT_333891 [Caerostris extrusa]
MRPFFHAFPPNMAGLHPIMRGLGPGPLMVLAPNPSLRKTDGDFLLAGTSGPILSEGCNCFPEFAWGTEGGDRIIRLRLSDVQGELEFDSLFGFYWDYKLFRLCKRNYWIIK